MRTVLIILILSSYFHTSSQVFEETWKAINSYQNEVVKAKPDTNLLQGLIEDIDTIYSRKVLFFNALPKKKIKAINEYLLSSFSFRTFKCNSNFTDTLNTRIADDPINLKDPFKRINQLISVLYKNLDTLDDRNLNKKGLNTIMRVISHNININHDAERFTKYQLFALMMIAEELENMNDRNYSFMDALNQNNDTRSNRLMLMLWQMHTKNCESAKKYSRMEMERNYQVLKKHFSKYVN